MRLRTALIAHPALVAALLLGLVGVAAAAVPAFNASERASFCVSCHEMQPYYAAWTDGPHGSVQCVECHVDRGTVNHITHKMQAAGELWVHLTGEPRFPGDGTDVPDARCLACHAGIPTATGPGFSHARHAGEAPCVRCHADAGHSVSLDTLEAAGILASRPATASAEASAAPGGHVATNCLTCHDPATTACSTCHKPKHDPRGECATCHAPGPRWVFTHPDSPDCTACHPAPAKHYGPQCATCHAPGTPFAETTYTHSSDACVSCHAAPERHNTAAACADCHRRPGTSWAFSHPGSSACASCHRAPARHSTAAACADCHRRPGASWAFTHPGSKSCASCHRAPSGHYGPSCSACHRVGVAFSKAVYKHVSGANCATCHAAPAGHNRATSCATCHRQPGASWAFTHPGSSNCSSCHKAPAGHYGTSCATCHRPSAAWSSATFAHPKVEHGYKAFACVKCHPSGYSSHSCTTCHGPEGGDDDDD